MRVLLMLHNEQAADIEAKLKKSEIGIKGTLSLLRYNSNESNGFRIRG